MFFGLLWITAFVEYCGSFIVICAASTYYFNSDAETEGSAEVWQGFKWTYLSHFGSIAMGSFIIAVIKMIKFMFLYVAQYLEETVGPDSNIAVILKCAICIIDCIEGICDYINESAFSYMAVKGDSFCVSAWSAMLLQIKHIFEFMFAQWIAIVFMWIGKIGITIGNVFSLYLIMQWTGVYKTLKSPIGPCVLVGIITYGCASVFLGLFDTAVLSMMTSMAVDMDMHDGDLKYGPPTFHDEEGKMSKVKKNAKEDNKKRENKKNKKNSI